LDLTISQRHSMEDPDDELLPFLVPDLASGNVSQAEVINSCNFF
jgi:hypothetical protein